MGKVPGTGASIALFRQGLPLFDNPEHVLVFSLSCSGQFKTWEYANSLWAAGSYAIDNNAIQ
jgi:hypothetical protein